MGCCNKKRNPPISQEDQNAAQNFFNSIRAGQKIQGVENLLETEDTSKDIEISSEPKEDTRPDKYGLVGILKDTLSGGAERASEEYASKRLRVCQACPHLFKLTNQCKKCGCFVKEKVKFQKERCPDGRW